MTSDGRCIVVVTAVAPLTRRTRDQIASCVSPSLSHPITLRRTRCAQLSPRVCTPARDRTWVLYVPDVSSESEGPVSSTSRNFNLSLTLILCPSLFLCLSSSPGMKHNVSVWFSQFTMFSHLRLELEIAGVCFTNVAFNFKRCWRRRFSFSRSRLSWSLILVSNSREKKHTGETESREITIFLNSLNGMLWTVAYEKNNLSLTVSFIR